MFTENNSTPVTSRRSRYTAKLLGDDLDTAIGKSKELPGNHVLTPLLMQSARFLTFDRRITECWSQLGAAVSTAQSLGLHRDASVMVRQRFTNQ